MPARPPQKLRNALLGMLSLGLLLNFVIHPAVGGVPANKAVASGGKVQVVAPQTAVTLLTATMRTSSPQDLILNVSMECSILTQLVTNNDNGSATASGEVRAWVEFDGKIVPINDVSSPGDRKPGIGDDTDQVVFCNRVYSRTVTDQEDPTDGIDEISDYIRTKSANSFQWVLMNAGNGIHTVTVKATLTTSTVGNATAEAFVGNRTLVVEPVHMANNASI